MGRSKVTPKKRHLQEEQAEKDAIQTLLQTPQELVEAAAAAATSQRCHNWPTLESLMAIQRNAQQSSTAATTTSTTTTTSSTDSSSIPFWLSGLGPAMTIPEPHFHALQQLHETIKQQTPYFASWSGSKTDPRQRAFGILPETLGYQQDVRDLLDISTPWNNVSLLDETSPPMDTSNHNNNHNNNNNNHNNTDNVMTERDYNHRAMVLLKQIPNGTKEAIQYLCQELLSPFLPPSLKPFLCFQNLIAAQPNLHCGRQLLPIHVDHPLKDGFGIVIVTISILGSGTILLQDSTCQLHKVTMNVKQGQVYMLSDKARDACSHGVLASSTVSSSSSTTTVSSPSSTKDQDSKPSLTVNSPNQPLGATNSTTTTTTTTTSSSSSGVLDANEPAVLEYHRESLNLRFGLHDLNREDKGHPLVPSTNVLKYWETTTTTTPTNYTTSPSNDKVKKQKIR